MTDVVADRQRSGTSVTKQTRLPARSTPLRKPLLSLYLAVLRRHLKLFSEFGEHVFIFSLKKTFSLKKMFPGKMPLHEMLE